MLGQKLASSSADVKLLTAPHSTVNDLLDVVRTALVVHKMASQKPFLAPSNNLEKLLTEKAVVEIEISLFRADMQAKIDLIQTS